ncbi:RmlC-like cupin [Trichodelitschia bisporula]|uniref:RmlC-like cupin n=1 Tax=Trichodelitschia bisporula TaxID=703511 RepID=A0A6G1I1C7_9PEZI|nr:RmlC-like cupin [Trichodelitschia bisporula]
MIRSRLLTLRSTPIASSIPRSIRFASTSAMTTITKRPWDARGHADHGWLHTFHSFSFANYYEPKFESFGPLRVINEDRVERGTGFGKHPHAEFLIWTYMVSGELEHRDSMGNVETVHRGEVQFTSAGTGIRHSEYNRNNEDAHLLQIWAKPNVRGLKPSYATRKFDDASKENKLVRIVDSVDRATGNAIPAHADVTMLASILSPGKSVTHELVVPGPRKVYVQVVMSDRTQPADGAQLRIGGTVLGEGDGAFIETSESVAIESVGGRAAEFILFDMES